MAIVDDSVLEKTRTTLARLHRRKFVAQFMYKMAGLAVDIVVEDVRRKEKLKDFPSG